MRSAIFVKFNLKWKAIASESAARIGERVVAMIAASEIMMRMLW